MELRVAPLIHARTRNVDFRSGFLVRPVDMRENEVAWAWKHITDSTRYLELMGENGRRVVFSNGRVVVAGITITMEALYRMCGRPPQYHVVDERRMNYAFVGMVIQAQDVSAPFNIPMNELLEEYEKYMQLRWEEDLNEEALQPELVEYTAYGVHERPIASHLMISDLPMGQKCILEDGLESVEALFAQMIYEAARNPAVSFCSDMPNATSVKESAFTLVTSKRAEAIKQALLNEQRENADSSPNDTDYIDDQTEKRLFRKPVFKDGNAKKKIAAMWKVITGAVIVVCGAIVVLLKKQSEDGP